MSSKWIVLICALFSWVAFADPIQQLPKAELHLHLTGSYPLSYLRTITSDSEYFQIEESLKAIGEGVPYHETFKYFLPIEKAVNTYEKVEQGVTALCQKLVQDGVVYAEIRTGLKNLGRGYEEYLKSVLKGVASCPSSLKVKLILSLRRNTPAPLAKETVDLAIQYRDQGVVGMDVSGDSTLGEICDLVLELQRAKKNQLFLALHLGESFKEIDSRSKETEQAEILELLQPDRIGHGVYLSNQAKEWLFKHPSVPIEVCPTSSVLAGMVDHHLKHPGIGYFLQQKHPIVIGTDDPLLFQTTLTQDYRKLMEMETISMKEIKQLIMMSFEFSFMSPSEKVEMRSKFFQGLPYKLKGPQ